MDVIYDYIYNQLKLPDYMAVNFQNFEEVSFKRSVAYDILGTVTQNPFDDPADIVWEYLLFAQHALTTCNSKNKKLFAAVVDVLTDMLSELESKEL